MTDLGAPLLWRLAALGVGVALLQVAAVSQIQVAGTNADLLPLVAMSVGLLCGSLPGAVFGFGVGFFADLSYVQTLGLTSLVLLVAGYLAGRLKELRDPQGAAVPMLAGAAASLIALVGYGLMNFLLGQDAPVSWLLARQIIATAALNALIAVPVHAAVRRTLASAMPDDPRRRRRRAYTTGGLSPLSSSRG